MIEELLDFSELGQRNQFRCIGEKKSEWSAAELNRKDWVIGCSKQTLKTRAINAAWRIYLYNELGL